MAISNFVDPNSTMVRRRQALVTVTLLLFIVILTVMSRLYSDTEIMQGKKLYYYDPSIHHHHHSSSHVRKVFTNNSGWANTLTRLGETLNFDPTLSCPRTSLVRGYYKRFTPKTLRCPQVFIIGAKKGGTTSLYQYLSRHPDFEGIRLNEPKWVGETFYFAQKYSSMSLLEYLSLFPRDKMTGDASVDNFVECSVPLRIFKICGQERTKIIVLLRHPVERYKSNFMMRVTRTEYGSYGNNTSLAGTIAKERESLKTAAASNEVSFPMTASDWSKMTCMFGSGKNMIYEGLYYPLLMNWLCNFPRENLLILNSEEMFEKTPTILSQVFQFLGLKPLNSATLHTVTSHVYNQGVPASLPQHTLSSFHRDQLNHVYEPFNKALFELLQWEDTDWS